MYPVLKVTINMHMIFFRCLVEFYTFGGGYGGRIFFGGFSAVESKIFGGCGYSAGFKRSPLVSPQFRCNSDLDLPVAHKTVSWCLSWGICPEHSWVVALFPLRHTIRARSTDAYGASDCCRTSLGIVYCVAQLNVAGPDRPTLQYSTGHIADRKLKPTTV